MENFKIQIHGSFIRPGNVKFEIKKSEIDENVVRLSHRIENSNLSIYLDREQLQQLRDILIKADEDWDNMFP